MGRCGRSPMRMISGFLDVGAAAKLENVSVHDTFASAAVANGPMITDLSWGCLTTCGHSTACPSLAGGLESLRCMQYQVVKRM